MKVDENHKIIIYRSDNGDIRIDARIEEESIWLTQEQIAQLFKKGRSTIAEHISNAFKEKEIDEKKVCRKFRQTFSDKKTTGEQVLLNSGKVSHSQAMNKAKQEYKKYQQKSLSDIEKSYLDTINSLQKKIEK